MYIQSFRGVLHSRTHMLATWAVALLCRFPHACCPSDAQNLGGLPLRAPDAQPVKDDYRRRYAHLD
jgi:hypothetical protein